MLALIMGGGEGTRLAMGEKPLVTVRGRPMLYSVIEAFDQAGYEVIVTLTPHTPHTSNWCRIHKISTLMTKGTGYIEDLIEAVCELGERNTLFTSVSDLPCLRPSTIHQIHALYRRTSKPACSAWVPLALLHEKGISCSYKEEVDGIPACPAGVNILLGSRIREEQDEDRFILPLFDLALHVNTRSDLAIARTICTQI